MDNEMFQTVFDLLQDVLPEKWDKVAFFVGYTKGSYTMKYFIKSENEEFQDCFSLNKPGKAALIKLFMKIDKVISASRDGIESEKWTVMTMLIEASGKMKTEFDYSDISENAIEYERNWKEKYLK